MRYSQLRLALVAALTLAIACGEQEAPTALSRSIGPQLITNGDPTGTAYGHIGALFYDWDGSGSIEGYEVTCSGSLVEGSLIEGHAVFLTAAHCLTMLPPTTPAYVSFDSDLMDQHPAPPSQLILATAYYSDPEWDWQRPFTHDYGVVLVPQAPTVGITPLQLPPAGYLDELAAHGGLRGEFFVNVGYGSSVAGYPYWKNSYLDGKRKVARSRFMALTRDLLKLLDNTNATGEGGVCYGDSGSPRVLEGTNVAAATVSWGHGRCRAASSNARLDIPAARDFLGGFLDLP